MGGPGLSELQSYMTWALLSCCTLLGIKETRDLPPTRALRVLSKHMQHPPTPGNPPATGMHCTYL